MAGPNILTTQASEGDTLATEAGNPYPVGLVPLSSLEPANANIATYYPIANPKVMVVADSNFDAGGGIPGNETGIRGPLHSYLQQWRGDIASMVPSPTASRRTRPIRSSSFTRP